MAIPVAAMKYGVALSTTAGKGWRSISWHGENGDRELILSDKLESPG